MPKNQKTIRDSQLHSAITTLPLPLSLSRSQHKPVYTVGKRPKEHNILADAARLAELGVEVHRTRRGGDVTYHGPGQFILYPIVGLRGLGVGARAYVEGLEDVMVAAAGSFGVAARGRVPDMTGVWAGDRKLGAIGVQISGGVSTHGLAFNHDPDLSLFDHIVPCGLQGRAVTSLALELSDREKKHGGGGGGGGGDGSGGGGGGGGGSGGGPSKAEVEARLIEAFASHFGYSDVYLERKG
jgi:lipoate-protein ligase B